MQKKKTKKNKQNKQNLDLQWPRPNQRNQRVTAK